ncbi:MAG: 30S ribosomal protein S1 [Candidatus Cloacimonetes bacterium]|nr:30S ribosomal protein S1 [Candidatus Cloacimonadota bacterium]
MVQNDQIENREEVTLTGKEDLEVKQDLTANSGKTENVQSENEKTAEPIGENTGDVMLKPSVKTDDESMLAMIEESFSNVKPGEIVEGTIVNINDKEVLVDIGFKSEGAIPLEEFSDTSVFERGTKIQVYINAIEDGEGKLKLSKKKADFYLNLQKLKKIAEDNEPVKGILRKRVKGGMIAEILGLEAFLPGSQISLKPIPNLDQFIGKEFSFKIINLDEERRNIIVSRKKVLEEELEKKRFELHDKISVGAELDGTVKNITDYGAFIDLGGIDGLLHITDMSWGRIKHPSEMLNIGDKLKVKVIGFDEDNSKVSLGLKQLVPEPWENIDTKYPEGMKVTGKVVNITKYGAFVELETGVEGLVHVSELSWTKKITHPNQTLKVGETVEAIVLAVSKEEKRISLGIKQMFANPWIDIDEKYPIGSVLVRKIKSITPFGIFLEIDEGIDGLVHISDISWTKRIYHPREMYKVGDEVEAIILSIDKPLHRIALGIKQLQHDPWQEIDQNLPPNTEVTGRVSKVIPKGLLVDVRISEETVVEGFVPLSHLAVPKLDKPEYAFDVDEIVNLKVIELDIENRRLILSIRAFYFGKEEELKEFQDTKKDIYAERKAKAKEKKERKEKNEAKAKITKDENENSTEEITDEHVVAVEMETDENVLAEDAEASSEEIQEEKSEEKVEPPQDEVVETTLETEEDVPQPESGENETEIKKDTEV